MPVYMGIFDKPNVLSRRFRGDVTAKGFEGWIELESAQIGGRPTAGASARGTNRDASMPAVHEIAVTKALNSLSSVLQQASLEGEGKLTILAFVGADGKAYMTIILQDMMISSYSVSSGGDKPMESLSLNFTKITFTTSPKSPNVTTSTFEQWRGVINASP